MLADLSQYTVANFPSRLYYIPDFLSATEERDLCDFIYASPIPKWVTLSGRRLQNWGGIPHPKGMLSEPIPPWLTKFVDRVSALGVFGSHCANHVLINEYKPGQGISPHHDGPLYFPVVATLNLGSYGILDFYRPLDDNDANEDSQSTSYASRYIGSALLQPRSLNVVTDKLYTHYMHGIECSSTDFICTSDNIDLCALSDEIHRARIVNLDACGPGVVPHTGMLNRDTRISVTIRYVPNVCKLSVNALLGRINKK
ncbi:oxidoreductase, 2OG-Fe(II) oxygenase family protein, partial [Opisthorchis viverrini]